MILRSIREADISACAKLFAHVFSSEPWNQGIDGEILEALENVLIYEDVKSIYLTTERAIPAAKFYQKNGYNFSEKMGFYAKNVNS